MFDALRLRNFKSHVDPGWIGLRPLTIIVGPNNSGKSSLLDSILLLKQTLADQVGTESLVTSGALVDLGGYRALVFGGNTRRRVGIGLRLRPGYGPPEGPYLAQSDTPSQLELEFALDGKTKSIVTRRQEYTFIRGPIFRKTRVSDGWRVEGGKTALLSSMVGSDVHFLPTLRLPETPPKSRKRTLEVFAEYRRLQNALFMWRAVFDDVRYIIPVRQPIPRYSLLGKTVPDDLGAGGDNLIRVLENRDILGPTPGETLLSLVNYWMSERFEMLGKLTISEIGESIRSLLSDEEKMELNVGNMGEGISQLLPIVVSCVMLPPRATLLVEQPELHLHPAAQANLGDLFVDTLASKPGAQFLIETHSEHLLLRVRRHIATGLIRPEDVIVLYVDRPTNASSIQEMTLDRLGAFETWPKGFFAEAYDESLELARAAARVPAS
jgi:predicted ATPase